jgi:hypothetical protein
VSGDSFSAAMATLGRSSDNSGLSEPFVALFPVSGAAVSTLGDFLGSETLSASDDRAAELDELQFDLGEGPCWDAMNGAVPVLTPDLRHTDRWPAFLAASQAHQVASLFAFPLRVGSLRIGAVDLYSVAPVVLGTDQSRQALAMAGVVSRTVLRRVVLGAGDEYVDETANTYSRRLVHQATGMVLAQLRLSADDARLVIHGHAFATSQSMMQVAQQIVDGHLDFSRADRPPEGADA